MEAGLIAPKHELRRQARACRDAITAPDARAAAAEVAARLVATVASYASDPLGLIALYASMRSELPTAPLANALMARGSALAYPRIEDKELRFHRVASPLDLEPGGFGIEEPSSLTPIVVPDALDTIVVPGLAFDRRGGRLGWGRGYYDRALTTHAAALRVAICFDRQLVDEVPTHAQDVAVDIIITEEEAIICPGADRDRSPTR